MPLLAPVTTGQPGEEPDSPRPRRLAPQRPVATWTTADGQEIVLTRGGAHNVRLRKGLLGLDAPPLVNFREAYNGDGAIWHGRRTPERDMTLPLVIRDTDLIELEQLRRDLVRWFDDPQGRPGRFTWARPDGNPRSIDLRYEFGLSSPVDGHQGVGWSHHDYDVVLVADDPYWYGDTRTVSFTPPESGDSDPFLPGPAMSIAGPGPGGTREVTIDGEVDTHPVLHMVGPMTTASWTHEDLGLTLDLTPGLLAGQTLMVRMGPGVASQDRFIQDGTSMWGVGGDFPPVTKWVLRPGVNRITTAFAGTTTESDAWIEYRTRYRSA